MDRRTRIPAARGLLLAAALTVAVVPAAAPRADAALPSLRGKVVTLDPGHNGGNATHPAEINRLVPAGGGRKKACNTTGTQTNDGKLTEAAFNFDVARRTAAILRSQGAKVVMTRSTNTGVGPCIDRRAAIANKAHADASLSIHADGGPPGGRGFHVIRPKGVTGQSKSMLAASDLLGRRVRTALKAKGFRTADYIGQAGLDLRDDLGGLNLAKVPAVLAELGNMRNAADARLLESPRSRTRIAQALAAALTVQLTH